MQLADPLQILRFWFLLEHFAPQPDVDSHPFDNRLISIPVTADKNQKLPWQDETCAAQVTGYQVKVGIYPHKALLSIADQLNSLADEHEALLCEDSFNPQSKGYLFCFRVDGRGVADFNSISVSTIPWALSKLRKGRLHQITNKEFSTFSQSLRQQLSMYQSGLLNEEQQVILTSESVQKIFEIGAAAFGWEKENLSFVAEIFPIASQQDLSQFKKSSCSHYLKDLSKIARETKLNTTPSGPFYSFMNFYGSAEGRINLGEPSSLLTLLSPAHIPPARWPSTGLKSADSMQQAAVNCCIHQFNSGEFIQAINCHDSKAINRIFKDLLASIISQRASILSTLENPEAAFEGVEQSFSTTTQTIQLKQLIPSLRGFEIVLSAISLEAMQDLAADLPEFFNDSPSKPILSFTQAQNEFVSALKASQLDQQKWGELEQHWNNLRAIETNLNSLVSAQQIAESNLKSAQDELAEMDLKLQESRERNTRSQQLLNAFKSANRNFSKRLFNNSARASYEIAIQEINSEISSATIELAYFTDLHSKLATKVLKLQTSCAANEKEVCSIKSLYERALTEFSILQQHTNGYTAKNLEQHDELAFQATPPWSSIESAKIREEVFQKAVALHRAWVAEVSYYNNDSIGRLEEIIKVRQLDRQQQDIAWNNLFMLRPVWALPTFQVQEVLENIGEKAAGLLFVADAGRQLPHALAGLLWRAQRAVLCGDIYQAPNENYLPRRLVDYIGCDFFRCADTYQSFSPLRTSALMQAHNQSKYGIEIKIGSSRAQWIGCPQRINRYCSPKLLEISNQILYGGLLFSSRAGEKLSIDKSVDENVWYDTAGLAGPGEWVPEQGEIAWHLFSRYLDRGGDPSKFVVATPFESVHEQIADLFRQGCARRTDAFSKATISIEMFIENNIGIIQKFEDRRANSLLLILGGDTYCESAIECIAAKRYLLAPPLNIPRQSLVVVGEIDLWAKYPDYQKLQQLMKKVKVTIKEEILPNEKIATNPDSSVTYH